MADDGSRERAEQRTLLMPKQDKSSGLPKGHQLQEFVVERVLGVGSTSVVYLARDTRLDRRVALKEYLPATLAMRAPDGDVVPRLPRFAELFDKGLQGFLSEARMLGSFDHASLLKVYRFWAQAGTGYMVMPYYEGITLKRWLADLGTPPSERWLRHLADPMMQALGVMHAQQVCHRDVAPDNILMLYERANSTAKDKSGSYLEQKPRPVLLDFGAARRVIGDATQNLTAMLKSGYSPIEQYEGESSLRQGPWTDVYALCAVLYTAAIGKAPGSSVARVVRDDTPPARQAGKGRYSDAFLAAIDAGLSVRPEDRPQNMAALRAAMDGAAAPAKPAAVPNLAKARTVSTASTASAAPPAAPAAQSPRRVWPAVAGATLLVLLAGAAWWWRM